MNLSRFFTGWNSRTKKIKTQLLVSFLQTQIEIIDHDTLDELVIILWDRFHDEEDE